MRLSIHSRPEVFSAIINKTGNTMTESISENVTVSAVTNPNCCTTGIGENNRTRKPSAVVPADNTNATPVVEIVSSMAS